MQRSSAIYPRYPSILAGIAGSDAILEILCRSSVIGPLTLLAPSLMVLAILHLLTIPDTYSAIGWTVSNVAMAIVFSIIAGLAFAVFAMPAMISSVLDGLYEGNVDAMRRVFHPACRLYSGQGGVLRELGMEDYYRTVTQRPSPASLKEPRTDRILSLSVSEAGSASATLRTTRAPRIYTDSLSLLYLDGHWQIVSKTYSWTE